MGSRHKGLARLLLYPIIGNGLSQAVRIQAGVASAPLRQVFHLGIEGQSVPSAHDELAREPLDWERKIL
jgi:hypothetical protein